MLAGVEKLIDDPSTEYLLAAPDDPTARFAGGARPAVGVAQLRYRFGIWKASPDCWLEDLFVLESARRAHAAGGGGSGGVGAALVELTVERARARGCRRIELDTNEGNAAALALYERCGFSTRSKGEPGRDLFLGLNLEERP